MNKIYLIVVILLLCGLWVWWEFRKPTQATKGIEAGFYEGIIEKTLDKTH